MNDEFFMRIALKEAVKAMDAGEVPIGAIVVVGEQIISRGSNMVEKLQDTTAHAEMIALTSAFNSLGAKYLPEATVYITVEPCLMCAGAMYWSKVSGIVWGADDPKNGFSRVTGTNSPFHQKATVRKGILSDECSELLKVFFKSRR